MVVLRSLGVCSWSGFKRFTRNPKIRIRYKINTTSIYVSVSFYCHLIVQYVILRKVADKSLARPEKKHATATKLRFIQHTPHEAQYTS